MASTFTMTSTAYDGRYLQLTCTQTQDVRSNASTIDWTLSSVGGSSNYYSTGPTEVIIGRQTVYSKERVNWDAKVFPAAKGKVSGSIRVSHDLQGQKSVAVNLKTAIYTGTTTTKADAWTLDPIARVATIDSVEAGTIGKSALINISNMYSDFTYQAWYKVGTSPWYDLGTLPDGQKLFTVDIKTANYVTTSMTGTMQVRVRTLSGTTQIGADVYKNVTVSVPDYTPTISDIALTGNALCNGAYVENKSTVSVGVHASTSYGATLTYTATLDGKTYTTIPFTSSPLSAGSKRVSVTVKDSRGKTATLTSSPFTVYEYSPPSILTFTVTRQSDGTTVIARLKASISSLGTKNTKSFSVTLNGTAKTISPGAYDLDSEVTFTDIPTDSTLIATAKIADYYTSVSKEAVLPTVAVTMDFHYSGTGVAFGKVAETSNRLDVNWPAEFRKSVQMTGGITAIDLAEGEDLDNIRTTGFYRCPLNATAKTLANCPTEYAFSLLVEAHAGSKQTLTTFVKDAPSMYIRNCYMSEWGPWFKVTLTQI